MESIDMLKPKFEKYYPNKLKNVKYVSLNSKLPTDVSVGSNKKITVNSINQKDNEIEIIFSANGFPAYTFGNESGISIYDKSMSKENKEAYDSIRPEVLGNNKYRIIIFTKRGVLKNNKNTVYYDRDINNSVICIGNYDEMYEEIA